MGIEDPRRASDENLSLAVKCAVHGAGGVLSALIAAARKLTSRQRQWVAAFGVIGISLLGGATGKLIFHLDVEKWTGTWSQTLIGQSLWLGAASGSPLILLGSLKR